jgi:hypothetical protein
MIFCHESSSPGSGSGERSSRHWSKADPEQAMIERTHPKLSVAAQCQLLSVSRSSFFYAPQGKTAMNLDLMLRVDKQFLETPSDGIHRSASKAPSPFERKVTEVS